LCMGEMVTHFSLCLL
nr:immunoglobulin heavy chain junction region [Mus musculus]